MKTTKTYETIIKDKYLRDKDLGQLRPNLINLTRGNIRIVCLNLIDENLSITDEKVFKNYFKNETVHDLRRQVEDYDIEGFRPIYNFLKGDTETIQSYNALELIAVLINFHPRPYNYYRNENIEPKETEATETTEATEATEATNSLNYVSDLENGTSTIVIKPKNKNFFFWYSNASIASKILLFSGTFLLITLISISTKHILYNETRWMVWQDDHYVEVAFDSQTYYINELKLYKEDRILHFREISVTCDTIFFDKNGDVKFWYGKNTDKALEYFTALGLHPETGKTLKPITKYMIDTHICKEPQQ
jgi:hypothetical protein